MSEEVKKFGELVIVAIGARNLNTRDIIGKGDPFAAFHVDGDSKRIKAEKRGGQHPNWDEEVRFTLLKNSSKKLKVQVFNEDKREHILIGDAIIDLSEVLEKSEWDSWHEIRYRNKYAGEVSLEMTFYYSEPPPASVYDSKSQPTQAPSLAQPTQAPSLAPQQPPPPSSYGSSHTPPPASKPSVSAPPSTGYPPQYPPPNSTSTPPPQNIYPPPNSKTPPPQNIYPPPNSKSPPPQNVYPPTSAPPQLFASQRLSTSPSSSSSYPPVSSSSGYPPPGPPPQSQVYPPMVGNYPPVSSPPFRPATVPPQPDSNIAFPVPVPTPGPPTSFGGAYPPQFNGYPPAPPLGGYQQAPYPPNNAYPPRGGYPPTNQGYPPNPYPPNI